MDLSEVLDRSRELVRSRGLEPAIAAVQAVDELAEGFSEPIDEERLIAEANLELSGFGVIQTFLDDPSIEELWINRLGELRFANASGHQVSEKLSSSLVNALFYRGRRWVGSAKTGMPRQSSTSLWLQGLRLGRCSPSIPKSSPVQWPPLPR